MKLNEEYQPVDERPEPIIRGFPARNLMETARKITQSPQGLQLLIIYSLEHGVGTPTRGNGLKHN